MLLQFLFLIACNNNQNPINPSKKLQHEFVLQSNYPIVGCGNIIYAYGFRFKAANADSTIIIGIIRCPDGYGDTFFKAGRKYFLEFTDNIADSIKGYSLTNPYEKSNYPTYLITEIKAQ